MKITLFFITVARSGTEEVNEKTSLLNDVLALWEDHKFCKASEERVTKNKEESARAQAVVLRENAMKTLQQKLPVPGTSGTSTPSNQTAPGKYLCH